MKRLIVLVIVLCAAGLAPAISQQAPARASLQRCTVPSAPRLNTLCTTIQVQENRAAPNGRTIGIHVVVIPPDSEALPDPIVPVPGGPGGGVIGGANGWAGITTGLRAHRAVVLIDPRGAGESDPLDCEFSDGPEHPGSYVHDFAPPDKLRACLAGLEKKADPTQYTTETIAADLAEVLTALGYERANFFGVSGGTRQSLVFANRYPNRVRTLTLGGMVSPPFRVPLPYGKDFDRSLGLLFADCAADTSCHAAYPDPAGDLKKVLATLDRGPVRVPLPLPGKSGETATVNRGIFTDRIRSMLYSPNLAATVPYILHRAAGGDFISFVSPMVPGLGGTLGREVQMGHYMSVTCSEDIDRIQESERAAAAEGTTLGDYRVQQQIDACKLWPHAKLPASHFAYKVLNIPTLLISGDADPVTPPRWADSVIRYLPAARHVVFPTGGHVPLGNLCAGGLITQFIQAASAQGLDFACAKELRRPVFRIP